MPKRRTHKKRRQKRSRRRFNTRTNPKRGGNASSAIKIFSFHNGNHYGDNILNLKFFFNISDILKKKNIKINYYYNQEYNTRGEELERFINAETVSLFPLETKPADSVELWMGNTINNTPYLKIDKYYPLFYQNIVNTLGLQDEKIDVSLFQPEPYLEEVYNKLDQKYKNLDILIINAAPQSGQFRFDKDKFNAMCLRLKEKHKVAVTTCIEDSIPCTMNDKLMLKDIGAISTHAKFIIGIHSGPVTACFNSTTRDNVKKWIVFADDGTTFEEGKIKVLNSSYDLNAIDIELA